jgi:coenzyme Q-binding protein COQ10
MPEFETQRHVRHAANNMFALVADIERYPEFVPLCAALHVLSRTGEGEGQVITATMTVSYKLLRESFTSRVQLFPSRGEILVHYLDGPFRQLENRWTFAPTGEQSCIVGFKLAYEFRSRALAVLMGAVFDRAFRKFAAAFEARADAVYGTGHRLPVSAGGSIGLNPKRL